MAVVGPRRLEYMPLTDLATRVHEDNPKDHDIAALRASMSRLGYLEPVALDERTGKLISGHGRVETLEAKKDEGEEPPEGVVDEEGDWHVPVSRGWASKDDEDALAALVALNETTILGGWRPDPLVSLLDRLSQSPVGLLGTGFTADRLLDLRVTLGPPPGLDDARNRYGATNPDDFWPTLAFRVPPEVRDRFAKLVAGVSADAVVQFTFVLDLAEKALPGEVAEPPVEAEPAA